MAGELGVLTLDMVARTVNFDQPLIKSEKQAEVSSKNIASSFEKIEKQSESTSKAVAFMGSSLKASIAAISISSIVSIADGYTQTAARIQNATISAAEYDLVQKHLYETANSTYRSLKEAQEVYLGTSGGLKELGYNAQAVLAISDSLSYSFVHNATTAEKAQAAMDAYGKILDKNKVEADAWFSLMVAAPNILTDVSSATGKTTQEIRKLGAEGKLAAEDLHKGFLLSREANKALADSMVNSAADGAQKLSNAIERTVGELNKGSGATGIFADGLGLVADHINIVSAGVVLGAAYMSGTYLSSMIASTAAGYAKSKQLMEQSIIQIAAVSAERQAAATALAQAQAQTVNTQATLAALSAERTLEAERLKAQISAQGRAASQTRLAELGRIEAQVKRELTVATTAETAAQERSNIAKGASVKVGSSALAFLGGPAGLGITVATVAAGYLLMRENTIKATDSLASQIPTVSQLSQAYQKLNEQQLIVERTKIKNAMTENREEIKQTIDALGSLKLTWDLGFDVSKWTKYNSILEDLKNGAITGNQALAEFNKLGLSSNIIEDVAGLTTELDQSKAALDKNASAAGAVNNQLNITTSAANSAAGAVRGKANAMTIDAANTRDAAAANSEYTASLGKQLWNEQFKNTLITKHNKSQSEANLLLEAYNKNAEKGYVGVTAEQKKTISAIEFERVAMENRAEAQRKADQLATKSTRSAESESKRRAKEVASEAKRLAEEQYHSREEFAYRYATKEKQIEIDLANEIKEIRKANFSPKDETGFVKNAESRAYFEKQLYLSQKQFEINEFQLTEDQKLEEQFKINQLRLHAESELRGDIKEISLNALTERHEQEMAWMRLEQVQRISDAGDSLRTDLQNLDIRYEYERKRIEQNIQLSREERDRLIQLSEASQQAEKRKNVNDATANWGGTYSEMTGTQDQYNLEQTKFTRFDESQDVFDAQMALADTATQREAIWQAHHERMNMIEVDYHSKSIGLQAGYGAQFAGLMQGMVSETSSAYAVLGGIQKGAALFSTAMNSYTAISAAWASAPFPYNLPAVGIATMETGLLQAAVSAISPTGYYGGGYTGDGGKFEYAGPAHKGEVVFSQDDIKRWGGVGNVEKMRTQRSIPTLAPKVGNGISGREVNNINKAAVQPQNLQINNILDPSIVGDFMGTSSGTKTFMNFIKNNRSSIKAMIA